MADAPNHSSVELRYRIAKCTSYSGMYAPEHILVNNPTDPASRWSGHQTANSKQWVVLELLETSLLRSITFGKFHKSHPCNMKEFKVYTGPTMDTMTLALHGGLNNDTNPETFDFQRTDEAGLLRPVRFVKVVPLSAHSPSFNTSIWHVALLGINDSSVVKHAEEAYASYKETATLRHVLKYLRQRRHFSSFRALQSRTGLLLEHPIVTKIYDNLIRGNWSVVESLIQAAADEALFDDCIRECDPKSLWRRLNGPNPDGDVPCSRGGHQMCIDAAEGVIYMFGGWDGKKNLDDLWAYSIAEERWKLLSSSTSLDGGPGPRSCHKMVFDPLLGYMYLLGSLDNGDRPRSPSPSPTVTPAHPQNTSSATDPTEMIMNPSVDPSSEGSFASSTTGAENSSKRPSFPSRFYRYTTRGLNAGTWTILNQDTTQEGGPPLVYDHQMAIDSDKQLLYVFGGRIVNGGHSDSEPMKFSGFYRYNLVTDQWEHILDETTSQRSIPPRFGHSMVFDAQNHRLIVFAGKKSESFLADMYTFDVTTQEVKELFSDFSTVGGPDPCFCQRAAIDPESGHIYISPGLVGPPKGQKQPTTDGTVRSTFWIFNPETSQWTQVLNARSRTSDIDSNEAMTDWEPQPRYGHQMVYDHVRKVFYVHGGNSGRDGPCRLDDFWSMRFERPTREEMVRRAKFITRRQTFKELCETSSSVQALAFLQRDVHAVVNHVSDEETATFRALQSHLFDIVSPPPASLKETGEEIEMTDVEESASRNASQMSMSGLPALEKDDQEGDGHPELSPELFRQRNIVFENLLQLINADAKQPCMDLTDLVDVLNKELL